MSGEIHFIGDMRRIERRPAARTDSSWPRGEIEAVISCLEDDAAQLRKGEPKDKRAANMDRAASMLSVFAIGMPSHQLGCHAVRAGEAEDAFHGPLDVPAHGGYPDGGVPDRYSGPALGVPGTSEFQRKEARDGQGD